MLAMSKNNLCCEFDYGQNLPLPKLPVSAQFYLRLMWLFLLLLLLLLLLVCGFLLKLANSHIANVAFYF